MPWTLGKVESSLALHPEKDPIWSIDRTQALRLLLVYEDEIGSMESLVDTVNLGDQAMMLFDFMEAAIKTRLFRGDLYGADALDGDKRSDAKDGFGHSFDSGE